MMHNLMNYVAYDIAADLAYLAAVAAVVIVAAVISHIRAR